MVINNLFFCLLFFAHNIHAGTIDTLTPLQKNTTAVNASKIDINSPTIIQFWASWCHSCRGLIWDLEDFSSKNNVPYHAINVDDDVRDAKAYLQKLNTEQLKQIHFWYDSTRKNQDAFQVTTVPTILVIDKNGSELFRVVGHLNSDDYLLLKKATTL